MKLSGFSAAAALVLAAATVLAQGPRVHLIHLDPQPATSGGCPARLHFTGHIEATAPMQVEYEWLRSDGAHTEHTLRFTRPGALPVSTNWSVDSRYNGWMQLVVLSPNRMQTAKAAFHVNCGR